MTSRISEGGERIVRLTTREISAAFLVFAAAAMSGPAQAATGWSWNLGYHNPVGAKVGLNFLYQGSSWGFELGIGAVEADTGDDNDDDATDKDKGDDASLRVGGDFDVRYFLTSGAIRPYLQVGMGLGVGGDVGDDSSVGAGAGGGFGGVGLILNASSWYIYGAYNLIHFEDGQVQAGLGFNF